MKKPKISVLMCAYNEEKFVAKAIQSILGQTHKDFEFIIVNDGSTDSTPRILGKYAKKDKRIIIINQKNTGLTKALNKGLKYCKGKYTARMDANDIALPQRFTKQVDFLEKNKRYAVVGVWREEFWPVNNKIRRIKLPITNKEIQKALVKGSCIGHSTTMIRANILKKYRYNEKFRYSQDHELWTRIGKSHKFYNIPEFLMRISRIEGSVTYSKNKTENLRYQLKIRYQAYKNLDCPWWYFVYIFKPVFEAIVPRKIIEIYVNLKAKIKNEKK